MLIKFNSIFIGEYLYFLPDFFFCTSIFMLLCFSIYFQRKIKSLFLNTLIIDLTLPLLILSFLLTYSASHVNVFTEFSSILLDKMYNFFKLFFIIFLFLCFIYSRNYFLYEKIFLYEYPFLILLSVQGSFLLLMSYDLFFIYLALELQNLCFYVLASIKRYSSFSTEAGLKYFLLGAFSSSLFLFGVSILYGIFGTLNLFDISFIISFYDIHSPILFISVFFLLSGLIFKLGGAPFH